MIGALLIASMGSSFAVSAVLFAMDVPPRFCAVVFVAGIYLFWFHFARKMRGRGDSL